MRYNAILFDLDGTLLPMDNDEFTRGYFKLLTEAASAWGYPKDGLLPAMWKGVWAMVKNDGTCPNEQCFWAVFSEIFGQKVYDDIAHFDAFYGKEFHLAKECTFPTPLSKKIVEVARQKAEKVVLATNPIFPEVAVQSRLEWIGLKLEDFDFVTHYSNSGYCKPNPVYYTDIMHKLNLDPASSLMVGNNAQEDAEAAMKAGLSSYLVTDYLICEGDLPECPKGSLEDLKVFLEKGE